MIFAFGKALHSCVLKDAHTNVTRFGRGFSASFRWISGR